MIEEKYAYSSGKLKKVFSKLTASLLTTGIWTDWLNTKSYLGLTPHYTEYNNYKSAMIGVQPLDDRHTSDNFENWLEDIKE